MIAMLRGLVVETDISGVVVDCGGVGYDVRVTGTDHGVLPAGSKTVLYIYEHIKEDAHDLYGFMSKDSKLLFTQLLSVKNVGPKVAMAILDIDTADVVRSAIAGGDVKVLQTAKGVGKRAAEQIIVELRDKVGVVVSDRADAVVQRGGLSRSDEAMQALVALGYTEADAQQALDGVDPALSVEERIKQALRG
jgi:holliday junction DNA helicase RuvA